VDKLPFVSCICLTYNRAPNHLHLIGEAVESYLRQTYPADRRQLFILNDTPNQTLEVNGYYSYLFLSGDHIPGIHVINLPCRFRTLGEKYIAAMGLAQGDVLMWWDDDDISLPWRVERSVERLTTSPPSEYYNPGGYWYLSKGGELEHKHAMGPCFNCSAFTRSGYEKGLVVEFGMHLDWVLDQSFGKKLRRAPMPPSVGTPPSATSLPTEWSYIYRWGVSPEHVSSFGRNTEDEPMTRRGYKARGRSPVAKGQFQVTPRWQQDYSSMVEDYLKKGGEL
jgi:Glycosyl transferase family 2